LLQGERHGTISVVVFGISLSERTLMRRIISRFAAIIDLLQESGTRTYPTQKHPSCGRNSLSLSSAKHGTAERLRLKNFFCWTLARGLLSLAALCCTHSIAHAQTTLPNAFNFQARLATPDGNSVPDGTYNLRVRFYDALTGGSVKHDQSLANIPVENGIIRETPVDALPPRRLLQQQNQAAVRASSLLPDDARRHRTHWRFY